MKKILLTCLCCIAVLGISAQSITKEKAARLATQFVQQHRATIATTAEPAYVAKGEADTQAEVYVFNVKNLLTASEGYVLVAAEEELGNPILGYSDSGAFDLDHASPAFKWWIGQYCDQIEYWRTHRDEFATTADDELLPTFSTPAKVTVPPLLGENLWNQITPYNNMCPKKNDERTMTGCGATSMAQILYFYKWPLQGTGTHINSSDTSLKVNFSESFYDWAHMLDRYGTTDQYTDEQANAVAKLMYDCGIATDMVYGVDGSSSTDVAFKNAMTRNFRYKSSIKQTYAASLGGNLNSTLKNELSAGRPIKYSGWDNNGKNGHTFVCDGYDDEDFFHFNWGWGGGDNGYFKTSALVLSDGSKYHYSNMITYNIIPDRTPTVVGGITYNLLNENIAEVARCSSGSYSGDLVIPSTITVDDKTYNVTRIQSNAFVGSNIHSITIPTSVTFINAGAFANCASLAQINVSWTTLPSYTSAQVFDASIYNTTILMVPAGKNSTYARNTPWNRFCCIQDDNGNTIEWTTWKPYDKGIGTYTFQANPFITAGTTQANLPVYYRTSRDDDQKMQLWIQHWFNDANLFIDVNRTTGACTVAKHRLNQTQGSETPHFDLGEVYVSDYPNYSSRSTYDQNPCTFDEQNGILSLRLVYFVDKGAKGTSTVPETFEIQPTKDCRINFDDMAAPTSNHDGTATQTITVTKGADVAMYKYAYVQRDLHKDEMTAFANDIASGAQPGTIGTSKTIKLKLNEEGIYTIGIVSYDSSNKAQKYAVTTFRYYDEDNWTSLGQCKYTDDALTTTFSAKLAPAGPYKVEIFQNNYNPGLYRLKAPYGSTYPYAKNGSYINAMVYIDIHAEDPHGVYIRYQTTGKDLQKKGAYAYLYSKAAQMIDEGSTLDEAKAAGVCGTFTGRYFTFPVNALLIDKFATSEYTEANVNGKWLIDLSELPVGIEEVEGQQSTVNGQQSTVNGGVYNLAGQKVDAHYRGIVIVNGKKVFRH